MSLFEIYYVMLRKRATFPRQIGSVFSIEMIEFTAKGVDNLELGKQIYELRKKANLSQEQLAEKVGVYTFSVEKDKLTLIGGEGIVGGTYTLTRAK